MQPLIANLEQPNMVHLLCVRCQSDLPIVARELGQFCTLVRNKCQFQFLLCEEVEALCSTLEQHLIKGIIVDYGSLNSIASQDINSNI